MVQDCQRIHVGCVGVAAMAKIKIKTRVTTTSLAIVTSPLTRRARLPVLSAFLRSEGTRLLHVPRLTRVIPGELVKDPDTHSVTALLRIELVQQQAKFQSCWVTRHASMAQRQSRYATGRTVHSPQSQSTNRDRKTGPAGATIPSRHKFRQDHAWIPDVAGMPRDAP